MARPAIPLQKRLESHIKIKSNGCWEWTGHTTCNGYGIIQLGGRLHRKRTRAHKVAYELYMGPIPEGMLVLHKCDNKLCVNPEHLELGDHSKNLKDAWGRGIRHPKKSKLSDKDFLYIYNNPKSLTQINLAEMFGISRSRVSSIQHLRSKNDRRRLLSLS